MRRPPERYSQPTRTVMAAHRGKWSFICGWMSSQGSARQNGGQGLVSGGVNALMSRGNTRPALPVVRHAIRPDALKGALFISFKQRKQDRVGVAPPVQLV